MSSTHSVACAVVVASTMLATTAQAQQSITFSVGQFAVRGEDARIADDVLIENLNLFAFTIRDFDNGIVGGEWLVELGEYFDTGVGLGYYRRTVPSVYADFINEDGTEIFQDFRLRITPVTFTVRVLPFGRGSFEPYFGVGLGVFNWRYSEVGEFIDFSDFAVFRERFVADGTDVGGLVLGGIRVPVGSQFAVGGEIRYQEASGRVGLANGFLADRIDLGGLASQFTFQVRF